MKQEMRGGWLVYHLGKVGPGRSLRGAHEKEPGMKRSVQEPPLWQWSVQRLCGIWGTEGGPMQHSEGAGWGGEGMMSERKKGPYSPGWGLWILSEPGSHWRALSWGVTSSNEHWRRIIYQGQRWSRGSGPGETNALGLVVAVGMVGSR